MNGQQDIVEMESKQLSTWLAGGHDCTVVAEEDVKDADGTVYAKVFTYRHPDGKEFKLTLERTQAS